MEKPINQMKDDDKGPPAGETAKVVAEMPEDEEVQSKLEDMKKNDGFPGSCGV